MSPEAFVATLLSCKGKKSITLFMPGIDPEEGFDINPNTVMLARDHPDFQELVDTSDSDSLWISVDGPASLGVGPIKVQLGHTKTVFDIRKISAIDFE